MINLIILIYIVLFYTLIGIGIANGASYPRHERELKVWHILIHIFLWPIVIFGCKEWGRFGGHKCHFLEVSKETNKYWDRHDQD